MNNYVRSTEPLAPWFLHLQFSLMVVLVAAMGPVGAQVVPIESGSWTLVILPDTQVYAESYPDHFHAQTKWIRDHAESHNIKYVIHVGDITDDNNRPQWDNALAAMKRLDGIVPYAMAPGNHDYGPNGDASNRESMFHLPEYFGPGSKYSHQPTASAFFDSAKTDNSYHIFRAGDQPWLVLTLEWAPRDEVVAWANRVVAENPGHFAILVTHAFLYFDDSIYDWSKHGRRQHWNPHAYPLATVPQNTINDGQQLWDKLVSRHQGFRLVFSGHVLGDGTGFRSTRGQHGNVVQQMLANYQMNDEGGQGDMRLLEFLPDGKSVVVRTYSPVLDRHDTAWDQQFSLMLNEPRPPLVAPEER